MNVLITGASRGLGLALAAVYAEHGHTVIAAVRDLENAPQAQELSKQNHKVRLLEMDVLSQNSIALAAKEAASQYGHIDTVINNAGVIMKSDAENTILGVDIQAYNMTMAVNTTAPVMVIQAFYPLLSLSNTPTFAIITSESTVERSGTWIPAYSVSKVAANKVASIVRATVGDMIRVLAIHPGRVDTDMGHNTAQISPQESADGIFGVLTGSIPAQSWYVDWRGNRMPAD